MAFGSSNPDHFADVAQRQRHRGQNAASAGSSPAIGTIRGGKRFRAAGESHKLLMVGSSPTPAKLSMNAMATADVASAIAYETYSCVRPLRLKKQDVRFSTGKRRGSAARGHQLLGLVMKWKTSAVESRGRDSAWGFNSLRAHRFDGSGARADGLARSATSVKNRRGSIPRLARALMAAGALEKRLDQLRRLGDPAEHRDGRRALRGARSFRPSRPEPGSKSRRGLI